MKEKEEDDDDKLKSANNMQINQRVDPPIHMKLEQQPEGSRFLLKQVREAAYPRGLPFFHYFMIRPISERSHFLIHIGGFWDIYVQILIAIMMSIFYPEWIKNY